MQRRLTLPPLYNAVSPCTARCALGSQPSAQCGGGARPTAGCRCRTRQPRRPDRPAPPCPARRWSWLRLAVYRGEARGRGGNGARAQAVRPGAGPRPSCGTRGGWGADCSSLHVPRRGRHGRVVACRAVGALHAAVARQAAAAGVAARQLVLRARACVCSERTAACSARSGPHAGARAAPPAAHLQLGHVRRHRVDQAAYLGHVAGLRMPVGTRRGGRGQCMRSHAGARSSCAHASDDPAGGAPCDRRP